MIHRWHNVEGHITTTIHAPDTDWGWADEDGSELPQELQWVLSQLYPSAGYYDGSEYTLDITFLSSGYDDPGVCSGPPEGCYPPEGEDDRVLSDVFLCWDDVWQQVPKEAWDCIYNWYGHAIYNVVIDTEGEW